METCQNCGAGIGKLETPNVWQDHVVCAQCFAKLAVPIPSLVTPRRELNNGEIICQNPNCGYAGAPQKKSNGILPVTIIISASLFAISPFIGNHGTEAAELVGDFLIFTSIAVFIIGALIALVVGSKNVCPRCGN